MKKKRAKLLYIVSLGHSGSTLLDLVCGTIPRMFSMGEMHFLSWQLKQGEKKDDPQSYCSCGSYFDQCRFWSPILNDISKKEGANIFLNPEKINFSVNKGLIRNKKYLVHDLLNKLFELTYKIRFFGPFRYLVYGFYLRSIKNTWKLYDQVCIKSNSEYVVDSSKNINRALLLKLYRPENVKLLVLKRDIKGVASSSHHGLNDTIIRERANRWVKFYRKRLPSYLTELLPKDHMEVSYESMCSNYNSLRNEIAKFAGLEIKDISPIAYISPYKYHTVQGNPMRLSKEDIVIRYDERWKERLTINQVNWLEKYLI